MNLQEARKLASIVSMAGNDLEEDAEVLVGNLVESLNFDFPDFVWSVGGQINFDEKRGGTGLMVTVRPASELASPN